MNRRSFIARTSAAVAALMCLPTVATASPDDSLHVVNWNEFCLRCKQTPGFWEHVDPMNMVGSTNRRISDLFRAETEEIRSQGKTVRVVVDHKTNMAFHKVVGVSPVLPFGAAAVADQIVILDSSGGIVKVLKDRTGKLKL